MNRRNFIRVISRGSTFVFVPGLVSGCSGESDHPWLAGWEGPNSEETDIRWIVLSYAILAANPHNKQPWLVELTGPESLALYVDQDRLLPQTDPPARQIHIGQGTFLENLEIAARQYGYLATVEYFPKGEYGNQVIEHKPVASISLTKDASQVVDPLFDVIVQRQSNKRDYRDVSLSAHQLSRMRSAVSEPRLSVTFDDTASIREGLSGIMVEAMRIETANKMRDLETISMFRFNDDEYRDFRDGFGIAQSGMTGFKGWVAETFFLSREGSEKDSTGFGEQAVDLTAGQTRSAAAFGWITTPENTRLDQLLTGRAYERLNLTATANDIAMHPLSQVLQEYADMAELQQRFLSYLEIPEGHTVQMLFRLGVADPVEHSPRRDVRDLRKG